MALTKLKTFKITQLTIKNSRIIINEKTKTFITLLITNLQYN